MSYFEHNARVAGLPAKVQPITTYSRREKSEFSANQQLRQSVRS